MSDSCYCHNWISTGKGYEMACSHCGKRSEMRQIAPEELGPVPLVEVSPFDPAHERKALESAWALRVYNCGLRLSDEPFDRDTFHKGWDAGREYARVTTLTPPLAGRAADAVAWAVLTADGATWDVLTDEADARAEASHCNTPMGAKDPRATGRPYVVVPLYASAQGGRAEAGSDERLREAATALVNRAQFHGVANHGGFLAIYQNDLDALRAALDSRPASGDTKEAT